MLDVPSEGWLWNRVWNVFTLWFTIIVVNERFCYVSTQLRWQSVRLRGICEPYYLLPISLWLCYWEYITNSLLFAFFHISWNVRLNRWESSQERYVISRLTWKLGIYYSIFWTSSSDTTIYWLRLENIYVTYTRYCGIAGLSSDTKLCLRVCEDGRKKEV